METYGIKNQANTGRDLYQTFNGKKYARYPIETPVVKIGDDLDEFLQKYAFKYCQKDDVLCISAKVVSIAKGFVVHESKVKITPLARLIVKFVRKWPGDIGYSHPRKMQLAIDIVGYPRIILALIGGVLMKIVGQHGFFYRIAGNNINAIDGFNPVSKPPMNEYGVLPPKNADDLCTDIEKRFGVANVILDGNNIDNNIMGMSESVKARFSTQDFMHIVSGNPQGQEDDGNVTPLLIVRAE
jgi:hypothetical protein